MNLIDFLILIHLEINRFALNADDDFEWHGISSGGGFVVEAECPEHRSHGFPSVDSHELHSAAWALLLVPDDPVTGSEVGRLGRIGKA